MDDVDSIKQIVLRGFLFSFCTFSFKKQDKMFLMSWIMDGCFLMWRFSKFKTRPTRYYRILQLGPLVRSSYFSGEGTPPCHSLQCAQCPIGEATSVKSSNPSKSQVIVTNLRLNAVITVLLLEVSKNFESP